jgi:hypothetical protein
VDIIWRINEFITLSEYDNIKPVYKLYDNFSAYNIFSNRLKEIDISSVTKETENRIHELFNLCLVFLVLLPTV